MGLVHDEIVEFAVVDKALQQRSEGVGGALLRGHVQQSAQLGGCTDGMWAKVLIPCARFSAAKIVEHPPSLLFPHLRVDGLRNYSLSGEVLHLVFNEGDERRHHHRHPNLTCHGWQLRTTMQS